MARMDERGEDRWFDQFEDAGPPAALLPPPRVTTPGGPVGPGVSGDPYMPGQYTPLPQPTPTVTPGPQGGDLRAWFQSLIAGKPPTPDTLRSLEAQLAAQGIKIRPNAAGVAGKIELPDGQIIDVIEAADAGGKAWQWLTPDQAGTGNTRERQFTPYGGRPGVTSGGPAPTGPLTYDQALTYITSQIGRSLTPTEITAAFAKFGGSPTSTFTAESLAPVIASFKSTTTDGPPPLPTVDPFSYKAFDKTFKAPTMADLQGDAGYQFRLQQGEQGMERGAAARGLTFTGGTMKALDRYRQDYATGEYDKVYGRRMGEFSNDYNQYLGGYGRALGEWGQQYGVTSDQYGRARDTYQFAQNQGLDYARLAETGRQSDNSLGFNYYASDQGDALSRFGLKQQNTQFGNTLGFNYYSMNANDRYRYDQLNADEQFRWEQLYQQGARP